MNCSLSDKEQYSTPTEEKNLMDHSPVLQHSIRRRNPYLDPLNLVQVRLLRELRAIDDPESNEAGKLRDTIFLTVDGIASGLRATG